MVQFWAFLSSYDMMMVFIFCSHIQTKYNVCCHSDDDDARVLAYEIKNTYIYFKVY